MSRGVRRSGLRAGRRAGAEREAEIASRPTREELGEMIDKEVHRTLSPGKVVTDLKEAGRRGRH